ncbi:HD-GYP domain-containing protein [Ferrimonas balearica]|uniref:HD-GYP domain-containing protein n=1 Tax=Ferrimonas balearica TaxID=44012 RepID=UPI001C5AB60A|nr:HD-GYP domain-containing protein [Ferrimonas balearica]MBW3166503.1 HD-GYP domain-containing protein [Ferrimonas balearica]MBY6108390.1 HD-GYP domain-containing protein [Ferrimonas balearica]MBY6226015.1 HD-GYP domain-containing protein [Ferrimonas balearica]
MIKTLPVNQVTLGMYVVDIPGHSMMAIRQQGYIRTPEMLTLLRKQGVKRVVIDTSRSLTRVATPTAPKAPEQAKSAPAKASLKEEMPRARKLYNQARQLQHRMMHDVKLGKQLELEPVEQMADQFISSVFRNASALNCLRLIKDKDDYLLEHSIGVSILMTLFARHLGYSGSVLHKICVGSLLHDIGKVMIPSEILNKPGKLTDEEFVIMKSHAAHSRDIIQSTPGISPISLDVAAMHHEKLDGTGYPDGLKGEEITTYGRMIAICDIYDAITADRIYHKGAPPTVALKRLLEMTPHQLDRELMQAFIQCIGVYPPGTMVELSSGMLAVVQETNEGKPLKPIVKAVYNPKSRTHVMATVIDLSSPHCSDKIVRAVSPRDYRLELDNYL